MRFAFLMHTNRSYEEIIEVVNVYIKQEDHVFIIISDEKIREKIAFVYADSRRVHISRVQDFAQEGDLSLARGTILQMKDALAFGSFDYFINIGDGMLPIKPREEIVQFFEENPYDFYYEDHDESTDANLRKRALMYYPMTNLLSFPTGKFTRKFAQGNARLFNKLGLRRKNEEFYRIGSPYFCLRPKTVEILVKEFAYVSTTFKLSWYAEEMYIQMMMDKFVGGEHVNKDLRVLGPDGHWVASQSAKIITQEVIDAHPEALFAAKITEEDTPELFEKYTKLFNINAPVIEDDWGDDEDEDDD
ncbi:hypothetical protein A4S06_07355 [Erysipelotrichaceae bacterium MTC7]|nr:hypothetical protein A4S06_07355 [Erysipelotrichaceae bacterium MTC7]